MRPIVIGQNAAGEPTHITPKMRRSTHMHVIGGSGKGKSKFLESMIRRDIDEGQGLCLIDWHGTLYKDVLEYCCELDVGVYNDVRSLILLNPSRPDFITGFNPFMNQGADISVQVNNMTKATLAPWGAQDTDQTPLLARVLRVAYTVAAELQLPLWNVQKLLRYNNAYLREFAIRVLADPLIKEDLREFQDMNHRDWSSFVLSTENRLSRFLGSKGVRRFMNLTEGNIDLREIMDNQKILLVNLGLSQYLDRESAKLFASLFLNEFFHTAMRRANEAPAGEKPQTFLLYLDEFQEYISDDIADMLEQVRKGGLHIVFAHQNLGQLLEDQHLLEAIIGSARLRVAFGGLSYNTACFLGNEMFLPDLNTRQIKKINHHLTHDFERRIETSRSRSTGQGTSASSSSTKGRGSGTSTGSSSGYGHSSASGYTSGSTISRGTSKSLPGSQMTIMTPFTEGWFGESESRTDSDSNSHSYSSSDFASESISESASEFSSQGTSEAESRFKATGETEFPVWVPIPVQEITEEEWSREEKLSRVAQILITQQDQTAFIKLDTADTQPLMVPFVKDFSHSPDNLLEYEQAVYSSQGALPAGQVDHLLIDSEKKFLTAAHEALDLRPPIDIKATEVPETTTEIPKPKKRRATGRKKPSDNLFDTIKPEDE
jgi:hypothetical protein